MYPIVNVLTKLWIQLRDLTLLLVMKYVTFLNDTNETEFLAVTFEIKKETTVDMKPRDLGGDGCLHVD